LPRSQPGAPERAPALADTSASARHRLDFVLAAASGRKVLLRQRLVIGSPHTLRAGVAAKA